MAQGLPVLALAQAGGHRLHRLVRAVQQQARPRERFEHLRREVLQIAPDRSQLLAQHTRSTTYPIKKTHHHEWHMTKHYWAMPGRPNRRIPPRLSVAFIKTSHFITLPL